MHVTIDREYRTVKTGPVNDMREVGSVASSHKLADQVMHVRIDDREIYEAMRREERRLLGIGSRNDRPHRGIHLYEVHALATTAGELRESWDELGDDRRAAWNAVYDETMIGRCGYAQFEPNTLETTITAEEALIGINGIRNSIIGAQNINWSEHIYPLVSLLNRAGYFGKPYPEAKAYIGSLIDRAAELEDILGQAIAWIKDTGTDDLTFVERADNYFERIP